MLFLRMKDCVRFLYFHFDVRINSLRLMFVYEVRIKFRGWEVVDCDDNASIYWVSVKSLTLLSVFESCVSNTPIKRSKLSLLLQYVIHQQYGKDKSHDFVMILKFNHSNTYHYCGRSSCKCYSIFNLIAYTFKEFKYLLTGKYNFVSICDASARCVYDRSVD